MFRNSSREGSETDTDAAGQVHSDVSSHNLPEGDTLLELEQRRNQELAFESNGVDSVHL